MADGTGMLYLYQTIKCEWDWIYLLQQGALMETPNTVSLCLVPDLLHFKCQLCPLVWYSSDGNRKSLGKCMKLKQASLHFIFSS